MIGTADGLALDADVDGDMVCRTDCCTEGVADGTVVIGTADELALGIDVDGWMVGLALGQCVGVAAGKADRGLRRRRG